MLRPGLRSSLSTHHLRKSMTQNLLPMPCTSASGACSVRGSHSRYGTAPSSAAMFSARHWVRQ
jgi:hypothetical protein